MHTTTTPGDPPKEVLSVHQTTAALGLDISDEKMRSLMRSDPELRALFVRIGRSYILPASRLPLVRARLGPRV